MTPAQELAAKVLRQHGHHVDEALRTLKGVVEATGKPWDEVTLASQSPPWPVLACSDICVRGVPVWRIETTLDEKRQALETRIREMA